MSMPLFTNPKKMTEEELNSISRMVAMLALSTKMTPFSQEEEMYFDQTYKCHFCPTPILRDIGNDVIFGLIVEDKGYLSKNKYRYHINVLSNGDVIGRTMPYYDADISSGFIPVWNQREIFELAKKAAMIY